MANSTAPFGFRSFGHRDGSAPTMGLERRFINSSDTNLYFTGDPVSQSSVAYGYIQPYGGSSLAPIVLGIFAGCEYYNPSIGKVTWNSYFPGNLSAVSSTNGNVTAYLITDPEMQFLVQTTNSSVILGSTTIGSNVAVTVAQSSLGNQTTGVSAVSVNSSNGLLSASSYPFTIVDTYASFAPPGVNGADNTTAANILVVAPNNWARRAAVAGVST